MAQLNNAIVQQWIQLLAAPSDPSHAVRKSDLDASIAAVTVDWANIQNAPVLHAVATSGEYADLANKPTIPTALPPNGGASGDLSGSYPNPTIANGAITSAKLDTVLGALASESAPGWRTGETVAVGDWRWFEGELYEANEAHTHGASFDGTKYDSVVGGASGIAWGNVTGKPAFHAVATSGSYNDLSNQPTALPPNGGASGDLSGSYPNPSIANNVIDSAKLATDLQELVTHTVPVWQTGESVTADVTQRVFSGVVYTANQTFTTGGSFAAESEKWTATGSLGLPLDYGDSSHISNKPVLTAVATSGDYNDLSNKPTLATVATSGAYADLSGKPTALPPNGGASGDLSGSYPNPQIRAQGVVESHLSLALAAKLNNGSFQLAAGHGLASGLGVQLDLADTYKWVAATSGAMATGVVFGDTVFTGPGVYEVTGHGFSLNETYFADPTTGSATTTVPDAPYQVLFQPVDANRILVILKTIFY